MKTSLPIRAEKLIKRWKIEPIDILFIIMNQHLEVIDPFGYSRETNEVLKPFYEDKDNFDISTLLFRYSDVTKFENGTEDVKQKMKETIRGRILMEKWQLDDLELFNIAWNNNWGIVDPFCFPMKYNLYYVISHEEGINISEVFFRRSDVEEFQTKQKGLLPYLNLKSKKKLRPNQIAKEKCREIAKKLWDGNPEFTIAKMITLKEIREVCKKRDGNYFVENTIRGWIKDLCPNRLPIPVIPAT